MVIREREERGLVEAAMKFEQNLMRQKQIIKIKKLQAKMRRLTRELERETKIFEKMVQKNVKAFISVVKGGPS